MAEYRVVRTPIEAFLFGPPDAYYPEGRPLPIPLEWASRIALALNQAGIAGKLAQEIQRCYPTDKPTAYYVLPAPFVNEWLAEYEGSTALEPAGERS